MSGTQKPMSLASVGLGLLALCLGGFVGGCVICDERTQSYTLSAAQIARVTEGTGSATQNGCAVVCVEQEHPHDAGTVDGGVPRVDFGVVGCSLSGQVLSCDFGQICAR